MRMTRVTLTYLALAGIPALTGIASLISAPATPAASPQGAGVMAVNVVSVTSPVARGSEARLVVKTAPFVRCGASVQAQNDSGRTIASLPSQAASAAGLVTFSHKVPGLAKPGLYPVTVSCQGGGKAAAAHLTVTVR